MELEEFGLGGGNPVEQLEDYCYRAGLGEVTLREAPHQGSVEVMVKVGHRRALSRAETARSAREKAARKWLSIHSKSVDSSLLTRGKSLSSTAATAKYKPQQIKPASTIGAGTDDDEALDDLIAEESDVEADLGDDTTRELLREVFGSSPSPFVPKERSRSRPSVKPSVSSETFPSTPKRPSGPSKKKFFDVFKQEGKVSPEKTEKRQKFKFNRELSLKSYFSGKKEKESNKKTSIHRSVNTHSLSKKKLFEVKKEDKKKEYRDSVLDDVSDLLDSSSSDSETFQKFGKKDKEGSSGSEARRIQTKQTVNETEDLFGSLKSKFKFGGLKDKKVAKRKVSKPSKNGDMDESDDEDVDVLFSDNWRSSTKEKGCSKVGKKKKGKESLILPSVDELLKLPETEGNSSKTMDDILDEVDKEIKASQAKHEREMMILDKNLEDLKTQKKEREKRMAANAILKARLARELTRSVLREMFVANLPYLEDIKAGRIKSERHRAFHTNLGTRQALFYQMINNPFTSDHVDWTYEEMARVWTKTTRDYNDNNDYIWKVLMPECFIKFYMDFFNMSRKEAENRIRETPLDDEEESDG